MPGPVPLLLLRRLGCQPGPVRLRIRYCATPAGRVAYLAAGAGPALLCDSGWITDLRGQLELFSSGAFAGRLAERFTVIRYDKPGCGLSDRDGIDLSLRRAGRRRAGGGRRGRRRPLPPVRGLPGRSARRHDRGAVPGPGRGARAVRNVRQRQGSVACRGPEVDRGPGPGALGPGAKALAGAFVTDPTAEDMAAFTRFERASVSAAVAAGFLEVYYDTGIRALLPAVRARTVVLHRVADRGTRFELGREAAALIPGAIVIPLPGPSHLLLPRRLARGPGRGAQFLVRAHQPGAAADRTRARGGRTGRRGADQSAIARRLSVAPRTAEAHVENIRRKLEVCSRAQIAAWVTEHRLRP